MPAQRSTADRSGAPSLIRDAVTAHATALTHIPDLRILPAPDLNLPWEVAHCCSVVYYATDQPPDEVLRAVMAGIDALMARITAVPGGSQPFHHDELAHRRGSHRCSG